MAKHDLIEILQEIQVNLARIEVHINDIKTDVQESKLKQKELEMKVEDLNQFKSKVIGAATIVTAVCTFLAAIGHDLIKRFMGWN